MIIYKITNKLNGKAYIGQTTKSLAERVQGHIHGRSRIGREILKYGRENFDFSVIDKANTKEELDELEIFWIAWYDSTRVGYNVLHGGKATKAELHMLRKLGSTKCGRKKGHRKNKPMLSKESMRKEIEARRLRMKEAKEYRVRKMKEAKELSKTNRQAKIIEEQNEAANKAFREQLKSVWEVRQ